MEYKIGFFGKFYNLWEHNVEYTTNDSNVLYRRESYTYVKILAKDFAKAQAKCPEAVWDETLQGRRKSWTKSDLIVEYNKFQCGKYKGRMLSACTDYDYLMWFYNSVAEPAQKEFILPILKGEGYDFIDGSDKLVSPQKLEEYKEQQKVKVKIDARLDNGTPFVITAVKNLNGNGEYYVKDMDILLSFPAHNKMWYEGYSYAFPLDAKGHGKRIKGKQLLITGYDVTTAETEYGEEIVVIVNEWKFA